MKREGDLGKLKERIISLRDKQIQSQDLIKDTDIPMLRQLEKYNEFVPDSLLLKSFCHDWLDTQEMKVLLHDW